MPTLDDLLVHLAANRINVDWLRQSVGKWECLLALRGDQFGRIIEHIATGPTAYDAIANCLSLVQYSAAQPRAKVTVPAGSLEELLGIVVKTSPREMTEEEIKSLML